MPSNNKIFYEHPLNERVRTFMRLEFLFQQIRYHLQNEDVWDRHAALASLLNIQTVFSRSDLKAEIIKELDRQSKSLSKHQNMPKVDQEHLSSILKEINRIIERLSDIRGQVGQELKENEFLNTVRQRGTLPGCTCDFDTPVYQYWLERPAKECVKDLNKWMSVFEHFEAAVNLSMEIIRESTVPKSVTAETGTYNQNLDPNIPFQMIRIGMPANSPLFPEISGGKHRFSIRFLEFAKSARPIQVEETVHFDLSCCNI